MPLTDLPSLIAVVPAAGVGKRMLSSCPKQYLQIAGKTILEHTVTRLLSYPKISQVIVVLSKDDEYFPELALASLPQVKTVIGGQERVDSVLAGLHTIEQPNDTWVLVHDAARPCVCLQDIEKLVSYCLSNKQGAILGYPVRDTMKRGEKNQKISSTVDRENLWHALTPQMYKVDELISAIEQGMKTGTVITDESSAIEAAGLPSSLITGRSDNIKITRPDDLALAEFILTNQQERK